MHPLWITIAIALLTLFCHLNDAAASPLTLNRPYKNDELSNKSSVFLANLKTETLSHQTDWRHAAEEFEAKIQNYNASPVRTVAERLQKRNLAFELLAPFNEGLFIFGTKPPYPGKYDISGGRDVAITMLKDDMEIFISNIRKVIQRQLKIKEDNLKTLEKALKIAIQQEERDDPQASSERLQAEKNRLVAKAADDAKQAAENAAEAADKITRKMDEGGGSTEPSKAEELQGIIDEINNTCGDPESEKKNSLDYWKLQRGQWSDILSRLKLLVTLIVYAADAAQEHADAAKDALARINDPCSDAYQGAEEASRTAAAAAESARQAKEKALLALERARRAELHAAERVKALEEMARKKSK